MKIAYTPTLENHLQYQLYKYSLSKQNKRQIITICLSLFCFSLLGGVFVWSNNYGLPVYLVLITLVLAFTPAFYRWEIKKHYCRYLREYLTPKTQETVTLEIAKSFLSIKTKGSNSNVQISGIQQITEIPACYFIELGGFHSFVLPKNSETKKFIQILTKKHSVKFVQNLRWRW